MNYYLAKCDYLHFRLCSKYGFWGQTKSIMEAWKPKDRLFLIIENAISGLFEVASQQYRETNQIWPDSIYPYRVDINPIKLLSPKDRIPISDYNIKQPLQSVYDKDLGLELMRFLQPLDMYVAKKVEKIVDEKPDYFPFATKVEIEHSLSLGITDPYEIAFLIALGRNPGGYGLDKQIIAEAVELIDIYLEASTWDDIRKAKINLVSDGLVIMHEKKGVELCSIKKPFWKRNISELQLETLVMHKVLNTDRQNFLIEVFLREVKKRLGKDHSLNPSHHEVFYHIKGLSRGGHPNSIQLTEKSVLTQHLVGWRGDYNILPKKINILSDIISQNIPLSTSGFYGRLAIGPIITAGHTPYGKPSREGLSREQDNLGDYATVFSEAGIAEIDYLHKPLDSKIEKLNELISKGKEQGYLNSVDKKHIKDAERMDIREKSDVEDRIPNGDFVDLIEKPQEDESIIDLFEKADQNEVVMDLIEETEEIQGEVDSKIMRKELQLFDRIAEQLDEAIVDWKKLSIGASYKIVISKTESRFQDVYVIQNRDSNDKHYDILSYVSPVANNSAAYDFMKQNYYCRSCWVCIAPHLGYDYFVVKSTLSHDVTPTEAISTIMEVAKKADYMESTVSDEDYE